MKNDYGGDELEICILGKEVSKPSVEQLQGSANWLKKKTENLISQYFYLKMMFTCVL